MHYSTLTGLCSFQKGNTRWRNPINLPVVPVDYQHHTDEHPECFETDCACHQQRVADLTRDYQDGLVSADDATRIVQGKTV